MDVDAPNILKRCSSAPLINEVASTTATSPTTTTTPRSTSIFSSFSMFSNNNLNLRTRRHSGSFSPLATPHSPNNCWGPRAPRVNQLRLEECADVSNTRELAHEREVHSAMQLGQSCEDLTLPGLSNSPTRVTRLPQVVSPSPTRKYMTRRSLSPIALRASAFSPGPGPAPAQGAGPGARKRRADEPDSPLPKRMCGRLTPSTPGTPRTPGTPDSDSLECTFRPVSPRAHMSESEDNHKSENAS